MIIIHKSSDQVYKHNFIKTHWDIMFYTFTTAIIVYVLATLSIYNFTKLYY